MWLPGLTVLLRASYPPLGNPSSFRKMHRSQWSANHPSITICSPSWASQILVNVLSQTLRALFCKVLRIVCRLATSLESVSVRSLLTQAQFEGRFQTWGCDRLCRPRFSHLYLKQVSTAQPENLHGVLRPPWLAKGVTTDFLRCIMLLALDVLFWYLKLNLLQRLWHSAVRWYNFRPPQLLPGEGSQCLLQPRLGAAGCATIRVMGSSQRLSLVQLLFCVPYTSVEWNRRLRVYTSRSMLSAVTHMILMTQTNVCQKSTGNLQFAQSAVDKHRIAGLWDLWSTSIRPLISQAMLLVSIAQHTWL